MRICAYLILVLFASFLQAGEASDPSGHPGGVVRLDLGPAGAAPEARYQGARVLVREWQGRWEALLGIPLDTPPGWSGIEVKGPDGSPRVVPFAVEPHEYPVQHLRLTNRRMVNPDPEDLVRFERERKEQDAAKARWRDLAVASVRLSLPARGRQSSAFGLRRFFNGEARAPHRGLDLAVPAGTVVSAPAAGEVTLVGDYFFNGKTVFIDHGQGLISMLCHLSQIDVKVGDQVAAGRRVALSGATGRATGPHLHWSVFLNETAVDPEALLAID